MHAAVPYSSQQAGGAQSRTIPYRSRRFGIGSSLGYAAFEWLGSTWCLRGWSQQPPGITPMPATQPLSKRPLTKGKCVQALAFHSGRIEHPLDAEHPTTNLVIAADLAAADDTISGMRGKFSG